MPLIGELTLFAPNTDALSGEVNANFAALKVAFNNSAVLTDVARTINVRHTLTQGLTISGGTVAVAAPTTFTAHVRHERQPGAELFGARTTGDTHDRLSIRANGRISRGSGSSDFDVFELRSGVGWKRITNQSDGSTPTEGGIDVFTVRARGHVDADGYLRSIRPDSTNYAVQVRVSGDIEPKWVVRANGEHGWGDGTTNQFDVRLRRTSAGQLTLFGSLRVTGQLLGQAGIFNAGDSGTAKTINWDNGPIQTVRMTGNCTFTFTGGNPGDTVALHMVQDQNGGRSATLTGWSFGGHALDLATGPGDENIVTALITAGGYRGSHTFRS